MKVGPLHLQARSGLARLAKCPSQMATCGQITDLPDSERIYDNCLASSAPTTSRQIAPKAASSEIRERLAEMWEHGTDN